jgi:outer membrane protein TolC
VAEALADTQAAARQMELARTQLKVAEEGSHEEMIRIKGTVARALETIDSFRQLLDAQQEILHAVVIYNAAQYRLFVAVGASPLGSTCSGPSGAEE